MLIRRLVVALLGWVLTVVVAPRLPVSSETCLTLLLLPGLIGPAWVVMGSAPFLDTLQDFLAWPGDVLLGDPRTRRLQIESPAHRAVAAARDERARDRLAARVHVPTRGGVSVRKVRERRA